MSNDFLPSLGAPQFVGENAPGAGKVSLSTLNRVVVDKLNVSADYVAIALALTIPVTLALSLLRTTRYNTLS